MISELIRKQIRQGQGIGVEFKRDADDLESIAKTVCAFLNTLGGTVFCGVDEKGKVVGIDTTTDQVQKIHACLLKSVTPKALFTVNVDEDEGKTILSIDVPEGKDRPYVFDGSVIVREGSQTRAADAQKLRAMIQSKSIEVERWERRPSMAMDESDLDHDEIRSTAQEASEQRRFAVSEHLSDIDVLKALAVYSAKGFSQAADVLFSSNPALRHPQTRVRVTRFASDKGGDAYLDDRLLQGPLVRVFKQTFDILSQHVRLESRFQNGNVRRTDRPEYPFEALREGLVNAFVHRDYAGYSGGITVGIYPGRIEIWNSGHFPKEIQPADLKKDHPSVPTNPDIAHVFYLRGLMERIGRGGQLIVNACQEYNLPVPKWSDRSTGVTLTLFGKKTETAETFLANPRQKALLVSIGPDDYIRPRDYREHFAMDVTERQARRDLVELEEAGLLIRQGKGAGTAYQRTKRT